VTQIVLSAEDIEALRRAYEFLQGGIEGEPLDRLYVILGRLGIKTDTPYHWPRTTWREPGSR
jgi:hypothetical protein